MSNKQTVTVGCGSSSAVLLTIVFVVLKMTGTVGWSWVWVLSPLWISVGLSILFFLFFIGLFVVSGLAATRGGRRW